MSKTHHPNNCISIFYYSIASKSLVLNVIILQIYFCWIILTKLQGNIHKVTVLRIPFRCKKISRTTKFIYTVKKHREQDRLQWQYHNTWWQPSSEREVGRSLESVSTRRMSVGNRSCLLGWERNIIKSLYGGGGGGHWIR